METKPIKLTWFAARKQWRKRRKGKTYYLGQSGVEKSDPLAYQLAVADWLTRLDEIEKAEREAVGLSATSASIRPGR